MGRPSEEQLLGLRRPVPEMNVSFEPPPAPEWGPAETAPTEGSGATARRWRLGPRDLIALAAVAAVVWLAVRSGDGLPFRSSEPPPPAAAGNVVRTTLAPDRLDLKRTATRPVARTPTTKKSNRQKDQKGQKASTGPGEKDDGPPTGGGGGGDDQTKPLLEATLPVLGTVTVDQPELPTVPDAGTPTLPTLPDTGDVLPGTPTVSLP